MKIFQKGKNSMEKQMDIEYTELDSSYNTLAKALANLIKQHTKTQKKIQEIKQQLEVIYNRLEIYIKNEFYDTYCYKKQVFILDKDKIIFYKQSDMDKAKEAYEDYIDEEDDFDKEFEDMYNLDFMDIDQIEEEDSNAYHKMVDFLKKELKKPLYEKDINSKQIKTMNKIISSSLHIKEKYNYAQQKLSDLEADYTDCLNEILQQLTEDKKYNFNYDKDELVSVRDEKTMTWHLIFYPRANTDTLNKLLN